MLEPEIDWNKEHYKYKKKLTVSSIINAAFIVIVAIYLELIGFDIDKYKTYIICDIISYILFFIDISFSFILMLKFNKGFIFSIISIYSIVFFIFIFSIVLFTNAPSDIKAFYLITFLTTIAMAIVLTIFIFKMI